VRVELARQPVHHAQRAHRVAVRGHERRARVEADVLLGHQRVLREARVRLRVVDHEEPLVEDGVRAERDLARRLGHRHADAGLEPLPVRVDQAHEGDGRAADLGGQAGQAVELVLGGRVEDAVLAQRLEAIGLVVRELGGLVGDLRARHGRSARARALHPRCFWRTSRNWANSSGFVR
jgi:hypothetical protein